MPLTPYRPNNPHPLSQLKTELVWEGKYDEYGNRREVDIAGAVMPLQKIETIGEPRGRERDRRRLLRRPATDTGSRSRPPSTRPRRRARSGRSKVAA